MRRLALTVGLLGFFVAPALAQQNLPPLPQPRLQTVFPPGAKAGTTVEVTFTGTDIEEAEGLQFSHSGLKAEPIVAPEPPPDPKKPKPAPMPKRGRGPKRIATKFKVAIAPGVPVGAYDVRLINKWGVSNPRPFVVGELNEIEEKEPNNDVAQAQKVELNSVVNGQINSPTDVDYFKFSGKKGQRVLMHVAASSIDSRAKPAIEVYEASGNRLTTARNYEGTDALGDVILPADGEYLIRLFEFTYVAGNSDYYYRLTITTGPWIDAIVPPMIEPGKSAQVTIYGRNLPGGQPDLTAISDGKALEKLTTTITAPTDPLAAQRLTYSGRIDPQMGALDGFEYRVKGPNGSSNPYLMVFARAPVVLEKEPNNTPDAAQVVTAPCEIAGQLNNREDRDWYAFTAKKGDVFNIELFGERIGAPADFYFSVKSADPKAGMMAEMDDNQESLHPLKFFNRTTDPQPYRFEVKADGKYLVMVSARDAGTEFGPRHLYQLRIAPEKPDFRLFIMAADRERPDVAVLHADGQQYFDVLVLHESGFSAPIELTAEGLPAGVTCPPQRIGANQKVATLVLSAAANAANAEAIFKVKGTAKINGQTIVREARPASITWATPPQQNIPAISRLDRQLMLAVRDKAPYHLVPKETALSIKQGDKATLNFKVTRLWPDFKGAVAVKQTPGVQNNQPLIAGITFNNNQPVNVAADKTDGSGPITVGTNAVPGIYSFVLEGSASHQFEKVPKGPKVNSGLNYPSIPITLTVVPKSLATVSASAGNIKAGAKGEVTVKVTRQFNYAGEYKLKLILPKDTKGITATDAVIPAGKDEAKLTLTIAADVKPGTIQNLVVQATGQFDEKTPVSQETKFNLNVTK